MNDALLNFLLWISGSVMVGFVAGYLCSERKSRQRRRAMLVEAVRRILEQQSQERQP
jgi:hypothetical protein